MSVQVLVDLRSLFGNARDQGIRQTCMAFAASDVHAAARGSLEPLSVEFAYYHAVRRMPIFAPHAGVSCSATVDTIERDGQPIEEGWPYLPQLPTDLTQYQPPADPGTLFFRRLDIQPPLMATVYQELQQGRPVTVVLRLSTAFYTPDADAVVRPQFNDPDTSLHAVIAAGCGTESNAPVVLIRNSWGPTWGDQGYAWLTDTYLAQRVRQLAVAT